MMNLRFIEKLINVGVNCSTKNGDNLINKEGLIAIIKDSCERNGLDNVLSVLTNGIDYIHVDNKVVEKYLEEYFRTSKEHNIKDIEINYVNCTISGKSDYKRRRYINPDNSNDYRSNPDSVHTQEDWYDDYDRFYIEFERYNDTERRFATPVEETTD